MGFNWRVGHLFGGLQNRLVLNTHALRIWVVHLLVYIYTCILGVYMYIYIYIYMFFFFTHKGTNYSREGDYEGEAIIPTIGHWKSCHEYFVLSSLIGYVLCLLLVSNLKSWRRIYIFPIAFSGFLYFSLQTCIENESFDVLLLRTFRFLFSNLMNF